MSGNRPFDERRFLAVCEYVWAEAHRCSDWLACVVWRMDIEHYRKHGNALTGATYLKGKVHPEVAEMGEGFFERFVRSKTPLWARILAWPLIAWTVLIAGHKSGAER